MDDTIETLPPTLFVTNEALLDNLSGYDLVVRNMADALKALKLAPASPVAVKLSHAPSRLLPLHRIELRSVSVLSNCVAGMILAHRREGVWVSRDGTKHVFHAKTKDPVSCEAQILELILDCDGQEAIKVFQEHQARLQRAHSVRLMMARCVIHEIGKRSLVRPVVMENLSDLDSLIRTRIRKPVKHRA